MTPEARQAFDEDAFDKPVEMRPTLVIGFGQYGLAMIERVQSLVEGRDTGLLGIDAFLVIQSGTVVDDPVAREALERRGIEIIHVDPTDDSRLAAHQAVVSQIPDITATVTEALNRIMAIVPGEQARQRSFRVMPNSLDVIFVCALTEPISGALFDLAYLASQTATGLKQRGIKDYRSVGFLWLTSKPPGNYRRSELAGTYAALMELDYHMTPGRDPQELSYDDQVYVAFADKPFRFCFLANSVNALGGALSSDALLAAGAHMVYAWLTESLTKVLGTDSEVSVFDFDSKLGFHMGYGSFGLSTYTYPAGWLIERGALDLFRQIVEDGLLKTVPVDDPEAEKLIRDFADAHQLDDLRARLMPQGWRVPQVDRASLLFGQPAPPDEWLPRIQAEYQNWEQQAYPAQFSEIDQSGTKLVRQINGENPTEDQSDRRRGLADAVGRTVQDSPNGLWLARRFLEGVEDKFYRTLNNAVVGGRPNVIRAEHQLQAAVADIPSAFALVVRSLLFVALGLAWIWIALNQRLLPSTYSLIAATSVLSLGVLGPILLYRYRRRKAEIALVCYLSNLQQLTTWFGDMQFRRIVARVYDDLKDFFLEQLQRLERLENTLRELGDRIALVRPDDMPRSTPFEEIVLTSEEAEGLVNAFVKRRDTETEPPWLPGRLAESREEQDRVLSTARLPLRSANLVEELLAPRVGRSLLRDWDILAAQELFDGLMEFCRTQAAQAHDRLMHTCGISKAELVTKLAANTIGMLQLKRKLDQMPVDEASLLLGIDRERLPASIKVPMVEKGGWLLFDSTTPEGAELAQMVAKDKWSLVSTGDPNHVTFVRVALGFPLLSVGTAQDLRQEYSNTEVEDRANLHGWEDWGNLPDPLELTQPTE